jgi:hypothetical protein
MGAEKLGNSHARLPAPDLERSQDRGEGRRHQREFKEHGIKSAVADTIIGMVDCPLRFLRFRIASDLN